MNTHKQREQHNKHKGHTHNQIGQIQHTTEKEPTIYNQTKHMNKETNTQTRQDNIPSNEGTYKDNNTMINTTNKKGQHGQHIKPKQTKHTQYTQQNKDNVNTHTHKQEGQNAQTKKRDITRDINKDTYEDT